MGADVQHRLERSKLCVGLIEPATSQRRLAPSQPHRGFLWTALDEGQESCEQLVGFIDPAECQ